jgi:hypothetical protein
MRCHRVKGFCGARPSCGLQLSHYERLWGFLDAHWANRRYWAGRNQGAEAVLLGGTDLFLAFQGYDCGFPALDCAEVHVEAIYKRTIGSA